MSYLLIFYFSVFFSFYLVAYGLIYFKLYYIAFFITVLLMGLLCSYCPYRSLRRVGLVRNFLRYEVLLISY
jgi:hypothetical protein